MFKWKCFETKQNRGGEIIKALNAIKSILTPASLPLL
jgi:hypothetical protein